MVVTPTRVIYAGLLGSPSVRSLGSHTLYIAREHAFEISNPGEPAQSAFFAVVAPNEAHTIHSPERVIWKILVEPECIDVEELAHKLPRRIVSPDATYEQFRAAFIQWLSDSGALSNATDDSIDGAFFGGALESRKLDARISHAVELIRLHPCEQLLAAEGARISGLSFSRFIHLFTEQIGMPFRTFCAWKRARAVLSAVNSACNLTELALDAGYPDSSHFSHSIRRIYGLRPRDMVAGSRKLAVVDNSGA
jgi:AraC-like DNA-binding protein